MTSRTITFLSNHIHPLLYTTISLIIGICFFTYTEKLLLFFLVCLISIIIIAASYIVYPKTTRPLIYIICGLSIGYVRAYYQIHEYKKSILSLSHNKSIDVIGSIVDFSDTQIASVNQAITIATTHTKSCNKTNWDRQNKIIKLYTSSIPIEVDDIIKIQNIHIKQPTNDAFKNYLIKEGITGITFCKKLDYEIIYRPTYSIKRWIFNQKTRVYQRIKKKLSTHVFAFFASLFLGNKSENKKYMDTISNQFQSWGILHYLARSGLHLILFIFIWQKILSWIPFPFLVKQSLLFLFALIYFLFSWSSISFIRAFILFCLYRICVIIKVSTHFLHLLVLICFLVLLYNPIQLFFLDFQLSFILTFALMWLNHNIQTHRS